MSSDSLIDAVKTEFATRLDKLKADIKAIPAPAPTPAPTNVLLQDNFDTPYDFTTDGQVSPNGKWKMKYLSGGKTYVRDGVLTTCPMATTTATSTYSTLVMSTQKFKNFQLDVDMKTNKMLRTGSNKWGGVGPNSWETAWIMFRYTDEAPRSVHHYYFVLKTDGYEFGKKDNAIGDTSPEKQIFIKTGPTPKAVVGTSYHITVQAIDFRFKIMVNGVIVVDMTDPDVHDATKMAEGVIGLYEEDSSASFDNVKVTAL